MKYQETVVKSAIAAIASFTVSAGLATSYAAIVSGLSSSDLSGNGTSLSSTSWNRIVNAVLELDSRTSQITVSGTSVWIGIVPQATFHVNGGVRGTNLAAVWSVGTDLVAIRPWDDLNPNFNALTIGNASWTAWPIQLRKNGDAYFTGFVSMGWEHKIASCNNCTVVTATCSAGKRAIWWGCQLSGSWSSISSVPGDADYVCATQSAVPTLYSHVYCANIR